MRKNIKKSKTCNEEKEEEDRQHASCFFLPDASLSVSRKNAGDLLLYDPTYKNEECAQKNLSLSSGFVRFLKACKVRLRICLS